MVVWSDNEGLYGDLALSVTDIFADAEANAAYHDAVVEPVAIIIDEVSDQRQDTELRSELSALEEAGDEASAGEDTR